MTHPDQFLYQASLHSVGSYQVSGKPWCSGSCNASGGPFQIIFPSVTRWVRIQNLDSSTDLSCSFSLNGLVSQGGTEFFTVARDAGLDADPTNGFSLEVKVCEMWFEGSDTFDVIAGLTGINCDQIPDNWSGSSGVG